MPRVNAAAPLYTSIYFTWSVPQNEIIEYFELSYSYSIKGCRGLGSNQTINVEKILREYYLTGLEENSEFVVTLTAVNTAGRSPPASFEVATLTAGEFTCINQILMNLM